MIQHIIPAVAFILLLTLPVAAQELYVPEQTITELKTLYPDTTLVNGGRPECLIVHADEPGYAGMAEQTARAIKTATGADVPIKPDTEYTKADREKHLICLGRMNNNKLALELYIWHSIASDDWFPGPGSYEVRTVSDPWGTGRNVIMLGGSDRDGVRAAVECFEAMLAGGQTLTVPYTIDMTWKGIEHIDAYTEALIGVYHREFIDLKALPYQAEYKMGECAEMYFLTGRREYAETYAKMIRRWMDEYYRWVPERQITTPKYIIPDIVLTYDLIEESPLIADDLKLELTNLLYDYCSRLGVHSRLRGLEPGILSSIGLHDVSESVTYAANYFHRYYPEVDFTRLDEGVGHVREGQRTMANSNGVLDNNGGYTPYYPTAAMKLALALQNHDFFTKGAARRWIEYAMLNTDSWGSSFFGHSPSFALAAWYYQDPTYVWFNNLRSARSEYYPEMTATNFHRWVWTYLPKLEAREPEGTAGLSFMRLHETNYEQLKGMGVFINVPRERTFHQLVMREGLGRDAQYLRLDGINDGIANGGDGNSIPWVTDGRPWMTGVGKWGGGKTMKWYNSALVLRDGQLTDRLVALCDLQLAADLPTASFVRSMMREYNGTDWARNIAWVKGKYWVVFDQFLAREADDYSIMCQWFHGAREVDEQYRAIQTQRDHTLVLQPAGGSKPFVTFLDDDRAILRQGVHGQMPAGDEVTMAALLYGHPKEQEHAYAVRRVAENLVLVDEPDRQVLIGVAPLGKADEALTPGGGLRAKCTMLALAVDEASFAGLTSVANGMPTAEADRPIDLHVNLLTGEVTAGASEATTVRLLAAAGEPGVGLAAGEHRAIGTLAPEALAALLADVRAAIAEAAQAPTAAAQEQQADYPRQLVEQWRFRVPEGEDAGVGITRNADLDGDGVAEVLVGTRDGRLFCLNADGTERWQTRFEAHPDQPSSRGQEKCAVNDIAVGDFGDGPRVLVASDSQYIHCLDAGGTEVWRFTGAGIEGTNQVAGTYGPGRYVEGDGEMMVVKVADLDADGRLEILAGSKTFMHGNMRVFGTIWCLSPDGQLQWHLYQSAGTVTSIATFDPDGSGQMRINLGSGGGTYGVGSYVCDNRGGSAIRHTGGYGEKYVAVGRLAADGAQRLVRLERRDGTVIVYGATDPYEQMWTFRAGGLDAAGPEIADVNGDAVDEIIIGSDGGSLFCLNDTESPLTWRTNLGEPISAVASGGLRSNAVDILAGSAVGGVTVVAGDGTPLASANVGAPVNCVAASGLKADEPARAVVGTADGAVVVFALE